MKKIVTFLSVLFVAAGLFAQSAAYQRKLAEAKSFEEQGKWVNALSSYYDAMEAEPSEKAEGAYEAYGKLADTLKSGKPGYGDMDEFDVYDGWLAIAEEYDDFWNLHCPFYFKSNGFVKGRLDMVAKTASYSASITKGLSNKYTELKNIVYSGWSAAWTEDWSGYRSDRLPLKNNPEDRKYTVSAKLVNAKGKLLFNLPETELKWGFDPISDESRYMYSWSVKNVSRENMRLIDAGKSTVVLSAINLVNGRDMKVPVSLDGVELVAFGLSPKANAVRVVGMKFKAKMKFVFVEGGTFRMGDSDGDDDEVPIHSVTLDGFYMGATEVTQEQWESVMGNRPSDYDGDLRPVENVSWYDILVFCNKLSIMEGLTPVYTIDGVTDPSSWSYTPCRGNTIRGDISMDRSANGYRLPTEAEWEYAARGGNRSKGYKYSGSSDIDSVGWYDDNAYSTHDVAEKEPNELGIYDMTGNVWEWVWDIHGDYSSVAQTNPTGAIGDYDDDRVLRGGGHSSWSRNCRNACRGLNDPDSRHDYNGFRVARSKM